MANRGRWILAAGLLGIIITAIFQYNEPRRDDSLNVTSQQGQRPTDMLNTSGGHVGTAACGECHQTEHETWLTTAHSRAMSRVVAETEPADGVFEHQSSARRYCAERRNSGLWHVETGMAGSPSVEARVEYLVGSGRHSRTYLTLFDGFLTESPMTWYASAGSWKMSPGYDHEQHQGFERPVDVGCLVCHCGGIEEVDGAFHRLNVGELAIGCERCHGPGEAHVNLHRERLAAAKVHTVTAPIDPIINPQKLSRDQQDALCAQCHLRGDATVLRAGKTAADFRPGRLLTEIRIDWFLQTDGGEMKVVGHSDQMTASRCWQATETLTCTTCHSGHSRGDRSREVQLQEYRQACLGCHTESSCDGPSESRGAVQPVDNCMSCHMPQVSTDIPHIAFTHHRIGVHGRNKASGVLDVRQADLVPFGTTSGLSPLELRRCHALACAEYSARAASPELSAEFRGRALRELQELTIEAPQDGEVAAALARISWEVGDLEAAKVAAAASITVFQFKQRRSCKFAFCGWGCAAAAIPIPGCSRAS
ncbi:MAG UNVERIFIED_CONTAM: hypothetical protein LVR18_07035 [Planctomycetaceae bacterium]